MESDPSMTTDGAMVIANDQIREATRAKNQDKIERKAHEETHRTVPPREGTPPAIEPPPRKYDKNDLRYGRTREKAMADIKARFRDRFPNL